MMRPAPLALAALGLVLWLRPAGAATVELAYDVFFGGFHVLTAAAELSQDGGGYRLEASTRTIGVADALVAWRGRTLSTGQLVGGAPLPERHEGSGTFRGGERRSVVVYDRDGRVKSVTVEPPPDPEEETALPEDAAEDTVDPLSVLVALSAAVGTGGDCAGSFSVFDGRRRYDLVVTDGGTVRLDPVSYSVFAGEARACQIDYVMLGGERRDDDLDTPFTRRTVWVASPAPGAPVVPVRARVDTAMGTALGYLTAVSVVDD